MGVRFLFLALLVACAQHQNGAWAAEVLSEHDAHLLKLLEPVPRSSIPEWLDLHDQLVTAVAQAQQDGGADVVLYGDSILEAFRGTTMGFESTDKYQANKQAWEREAPPRSLVLGIAGDQAPHLLWRLQNGEGPKGLDPRHIVMMIGTNDIAHLSSMHGYNSTLVGHIIALGVQLCVVELRQQCPGAQITVLGLLPLQPLMLRAPQRLFDGMVEAANGELRGFVEADASGKLAFKDCGDGFRGADGAVNYELMSDGVHPTGGGAGLLLGCIKGAVSR